MPLYTETIRKFATPVTNNALLVEQQHMYRCDTQESSTLYDMLGVAMDQVCVIKVDVLTSPNKCVVKIVLHYSLNLPHATNNQQGHLTNVAPLYLDFM